MIDDDIDLEALKAQHSTTPDRDRLKCPDCGSVRVRKKVDSATPREHPEAHQCLECFSHFDRPD